MEEISKCVVMMESVFAYMDTAGMGIPKNASNLRVMVNGQLYSVTFNFFPLQFFQFYFVAH